MNLFYVEVVESDTGKCIERLGPMSERKAEKVDAGLNINLHHSMYYTRICLNTRLTVYR